MEEHLHIVMASNMTTSDDLDRADTPSKRHTVGGGLQADQVMNTIEAERRQKIEDIGHNIPTKMNTTTVHLDLEDDQVLLLTTLMMMKRRTSQSTGNPTKSHDGSSDMRTNFTMST
jgi:hypothetical protein